MEQTRENQMATKKQVIQFKIQEKENVMETEQDTIRLLTTPLLPEIKSQEESVLLTLLSASAHVSRFLRSSPTVKLDTSNPFGDVQLHQDVYCDELIEEYLRANPSIRGFASEERPEYIAINNQAQENPEEGYIITYDPIDGSSILDTNFSVGSIFSIWKYDAAEQRQLIGKTLDQQVGAILVTYGSRTTAVLYNSASKAVQEYTLIEKYTHDFIKKDEWVISNKYMHIAPTTNIFSPGNFRASSDHPVYKDAILSFMQRGFTLRYSGGLVPDVEQILVKGHGIFCCIPSVKHKAKLRVLYEVACVGFLIEKAGGKCLACKTSRGEKENGMDLMQVKIEGYDDRIGFAVGSSQEVDNLVRLQCLSGM